ncbi:MAG: family 78 glycoside hydrolase catalytic domain [Bacteroidetes bacterium]|nr:family 78 glycoside hydrolase catalytic domain [Bacteroidota bacterium]
MKQRLFLLLILLISSGVIVSANSSPALQVENLRVEYKEKPLGIDVDEPRLSWMLEGEGRNRFQTAYQIVVASSKQKLASGEWDVWNSKKVNSDATNQIVYGGTRLQSGTPYYWKVRVWDENDLASDWSDESIWSMGMLNYSDWKGIFISLGAGHFTGHPHEGLYLPPARYLRKAFNLDKPVKRATAYTTALGVYEFRLNGDKVGDQYLLPGWTDYRKRLYYQAFDLTDALVQGENVVGAVVADGWYAGYVGFALLNKQDRVRDLYGNNPAFMGQLIIEYEDGSKEIIASDPSWKASLGAIQEADIIMGERHDARLEQQGWDAPGFDAGSWNTPKLYPYPEGRLQAYPGTLIRERERLAAQSVTEPEPGIYVIDLGKNIAGIAELKVEGPEGTAVQLKYGEMLNADGTVMTENLRLARATDTYILKGEGVEVWQPKFTYHGFQYVELSGFPGKPGLDAITGIVLSSTALDASTFSCSNEMNNTLYRNIRTTQSANFIDIPTDCPQRDERLGWTGDAQIYCRSASYNADVAAFFTKYAIDLDDSQRWYGAYPNFSPFGYSRLTQYSPAWMEAGVIIPYNNYQVYGDTRIIEYMYPGMQRFMEFEADASSGYLRPGGGSNWGDWLSLDEVTSDDFIASAYYAYCAELMQEMAHALGKEKDAKHYQVLLENIQKAFAGKYILDNGHTSEETQTSYALALYFNLYPEELAQKGADRLVEKITQNGNRFATGFLGTKHVMLVLAKYSYDDLAYKLFKQTEYPSWGYSVVNGSTSIWERWNSYTKDADKNSQINMKMNSFSHYAFGSVTEWMFINGLGIDTEGPGFKRITIKPSVSAEMEFMKGSYQSINGTIASAWELKGKKLGLRVEIPVNTTARIHIPTSKSSSVKENSKPVSKVPGIKIVETNDHETILEVGSGQYEFSVVRN